MLKYYNYDITLQEIPNEISLVFSIIGCGFACKGCHSEHLWEGQDGKYLTNSDLVDYITKYKDSISCVLFMGGEWDKIDIISKLDIISSYGIKTALYTGHNMNYIQKILFDVYKRLDYIKTGRWIESLGGLNSPTTNQELFDIKNNKPIIMF